MTKITFYKTEDGIYYGFRENGHSGYEDAGKDIVCAAISAMTMLIINTVEVAHGSSVDYKIDDETTDIEVICKGALPKYEADKKKNYAIASLMLGYYHQLHDMLEDYYEYLDVDEQVRKI
jgi:uncharacterized protein YsxB (DUF464 family)